MSTSAKTRERTWSVGKVSDHVAQLVAGAARTAELQPRPLTAAGRVATLRARAVFVV